jgi:cytochrome c
MEALRQLSLSLTAVFATISVPQAQAGPEETAANAGCTFCHGQETGQMGPSFKDIAARYSGDAEAAEKLFAATRNGSTGAWGDMPMMAVGEAQISDADLQAVIAWLLEQ